MEPSGVEGGTGGTDDMGGVGGHAGSSGTGGGDPIGGDGGASGGGEGGSAGASGQGGTSGSGGQGGAGRGGDAGTSFEPPDSCSEDADCDDGNPCTDDVCDDNDECQYENNDASCDDGDSCTTGDACRAGMCVGAPTCGEECSMACPEPDVTPVAAGIGHTCARKPDGAIRCWGDDASSELGYPPDATPGGDVEVGGPVLQLALSSSHTCALLSGGGVRCWGSTEYAGLGYGNWNNIGDEPGETPASAGDVDVGGPALHIDTLLEHTCAALVDGAVRCWGVGGAKLGYGDGSTDWVGGSQTPVERGVVDVGGHAIQVATGEAHSCALLIDGTVRCWGAPDLLGTQAVFSLGSTSPPSEGPLVELGGKATYITAGRQHTCALLEDQSLVCWGITGFGALGYGDLETVGDDETPAEKGPVNVGGMVIQVSAGHSHTCALLEDHTVRCWGRASDGVLGYGDLEHVGDDETPAEKGPVDVGGDVSYVSAGGNHTCIMLANDAIRCWGSNQFGQLGYAESETIGDDEPPASAGDVPWLD